MLDYSYPLFFLNWKTGRSGRGGGKGVGRGRGPPFFALSSSRAQRMKIRRRQRDFLQPFLLNFDLFVRLFKQIYSQSREDNKQFYPHDLA